MSISITAPVSGATVSGTVAVTGTDSGQVVTAKVGTTTVGTQTLAAQNFSVNVDTTALANGTQTITVSDANGTASVSVNVQNIVTKQLVYTSGTSITMPSDWNPLNNLVEVTAAGGGGGGGGGLGGGSGGYSATPNVNVAANSVQPVSFGAGGVGAAYNAGATPGGTGGDTFFGATTKAASLVAANGGGGGNYSTPGAGGSTTGAIGTTKKAGTAGGTNANDPGAGGAGAPGPDGLGATGGTETATVGGPGGQGDATHGGAGGAGGTTTGAGAAGAANPNGGGGGGGGGASGSGGNGGLPGGGGGGAGYTATSGKKGGDGGGGQVRLTWTPAAGGGSGSAPKVFYGVNGHFDYPESTATIIAALKYMGFTVYRMAYEGDSTSLNACAAMAAAFKADGTGLQLYVCIDCSDKDTNGNFYTSNSAAYNAGHADGIVVANALAPYVSNVMAIEVGNEMARKDNIVLNPSIMGTDPTDFNQSEWFTLANVCAGETDGVRSILPTMPITNNALTFAEYAVADMLWNGTNPNGSSGNTPIHWDLTSLHSYASWGDPVNISYDGDGTVRFDLYAHLSTSFGKPLVISEWGADATGSMTDAQQIAWNNTMLAEMYARRESLGGAVKIRSHIMYELYNTDYNWGVMVNGSSTQTTAIGAPVKTFIAAHPDV
jgi:hypothetical protein